MSLPCLLPLPSLSPPLPLLPLSFPFPPSSFLLFSLSQLLLLFHQLTPSLILAINQIALGEGLALAKALGIDPVLMHNIINTSSGQSWSSKVNSPLPEVEGGPGARGYTGGFQTKLMLKVSVASAEPQAARVTVSHRLLRARQAASVTSGQPMASLSQLWASCGETSPRC